MKPTPSSCTLAIRATPNAPRNEVMGRFGEAVKIKIHAPPVDGRANEELCAFLADTLQLPKRSVTLKHGDGSRDKLVHIVGLTRAEALTRLGLG